MLCMQYSGAAGETITINIVVVLTQAAFAAAVTIPGMAVFAAAFTPQVAYNLLCSVVRAPVRCWRARHRCARARVESNTNDDGACVSEVGKSESVREPGRGS